MTIRMLQQQRSPESILSTLIKGGRMSRRQAYRYLLQAQNDLQPRPMPEAKALFTVNLPRRLIQQVRDRCRRQRRPISHLVAAALEQWLKQPSIHG